MSSSFSLPDGTDWVSRVVQRAATNMDRYHGCTQTLIDAFLNELEIDAPGALKSAGGMMAGLMVSETCGIHTAGMMILGLIMGREDISQGMDGVWPIVAPGQRLMIDLTRALGSASCRELTDVDFTDLNQALAYMSGDGHHQCVARVKTGALIIAEHMTRLHRSGELFTPEVKTSTSDSP